MGIWFLLSCKRYLKRLSFILILLLFPVAAGLFMKSGQADEEGIVIAVCSLDREEDSLGFRLARRLEEYGDGMFSFRLYEDPQQVEEAVASRRAECGYVIGEDLEEKLDQGNYRRQIQVYLAPSTVADGMAEEVVYSLLAQEYHRKIFIDYVAGSQVFDFLEAEGQRQEGIALGEELYDQYSSDGSTFHFTYEDMDGKPEERAKAAAVFPARGLGAVLIFTAGLYGAVCLKGDEKRGIFLPLAFERREVCRLASLAAPVCLAAASGLAALLACGGFTSWLRELGWMGAYAAAVVIYARILGRIVPSERAVCCLLPFFILGSLIFCPVFLDLGQIWPEAREMGRLFLPYYYLSGF